MNRDVPPRHHRSCDHAPTAPVTRSSIGHVSEDNADDWRNSNAEQKIESNECF